MERERQGWGGGEVRGGRRGGEGRDGEGKRDQTDPNKSHVKFIEEDARSKKTF